MPDKDQIYIFNNTELELIKNTFAENEVLLYAVRKVLLQFPLTDQEQSLIKKAVTPEVLRVLKKRILPELSPEFPLGQLPSLITTVTDKMKQLTPQEAEVHLNALKLEIEYLTQQFDVLAGKGTEKIKLADLAVLSGKDTETRFRDVSAYLFLLGYIDPMLLMIKTIAGTKEETIEQLNARMKRNSTK